MAITFPKGIPGQIKTIHPNLIISVQSKKNRKAPKFRGFSAIYHIQTQVLRLYISLKLTIPAPYYLLLIHLRHLRFHHLYLLGK